MKTKIRIIGALAVASLWLVLCLCAWFKQPDPVSEAERRPLEQFPAVNSQTILQGSFMVDFEDYTLDQFPLRDTWRSLKALFHTNVLQQMDNNEIFIYDGYAAKVNYPINTQSLSYAAEKFGYLYQTYLQDSQGKIFLAVVPDKGVYIAQESEYPGVDYESFTNQLAQQMPYAQMIDLKDALTLEDYYRTDTHWRQENLLNGATAICQAMGVTPPKAEDFTQVALERPFYGVYYGQAALPMEAETMYVLESDLLKQCLVTNHENCKPQKDEEGKVTFDHSKCENTAIYNLELMENHDMYDIFLSGMQGYVEITNPNAATNRELIVFRDSFGSSMVPLLLQDYARVTVLDIRYVSSFSLNGLIDFHGQDVLFLYSTLVLNDSDSLT